MKNHLTLLMNVALLLLLATGCASESELPKKQTVDWDMTAFVVQEDGTVEDTFPMTIIGTIRREETESYLDLEIDVPREFRYSFKAEDDGYYCINSKARQSGDFILSCYTYDKSENAPAYIEWAVNTEKEYFIGYWGKGYDRFLVAVADPDATPEDVMEHFEEWVALQTESAEQRI